MTRLPLAFAVAIPDSSFDAAVAAATAAEEAGFASVSFGDRPPAPGIDGWMLAAAIAARTSSVRLFHTTLNLPYRYPQLLAKQAAAIDAISGGRLDLCLGAGGTIMSADYDAYGIPLKPVRERLDDLIEAITLMRGLWANETFSFAGHSFHVDNAMCAPKPVNGTIPIWTGAGKPRGLRIVGRFADGWIKNRGWGSVEEVAEMKAIVDSAAVAAGRDPQSIRCVLGAAAHLATLPSAADAFRTANPQAAGLVGTPDEILATIEDYRAIGVDTFQLRVAGADPAEQIRLFGQHVVRVAS